MPDLDTAVVQFEVYEDSVDFYGMAEVQLPDIPSITQTISGAGIGGKVEEVLLGLVDVMNMNLNFRTFSNTTAQLAEPRRHKLELRAAQQITDTATGTVKIQSVKHVVMVMPKKIGLGKLAPASPSDANGDYAVSYIASYIDGASTLEIDPYNYKYVVNGVDYLADVRNAVGK